MRRAVALLALPLFLISACGSSTVTLGQARPNGQVRVDTEPGQIVRPADWPDACLLIGEADVKAILPQATEVRQTPMIVWPTTIDQFAQSPEDAEPEYASTGACLYKFQLPGEQTDLSRVLVQIEAVADPDLLARYFDTRVHTTVEQSLESPPRDVDDCRLVDGYLSDHICRKGPVMFRLTGHTTVAFNGQPETTIFSFWRDEVMPQFATNVGMTIRSE
jgi:hypothetical protein